MDSSPSTNEKTKSGNLVINTIKWTVLLFLSTFGVLIGFGLILGVLETKNQSLMYSSLGWFGICITGIIGTPVHEIAHYILCLPFGIHVEEVSLFRPIAGKADGVLGYVRYTMDKGNLWQSIGTLFVGIAPMVLGPLLLLVLIRIFMPECYSEIKTHTGDDLSEEKITVKSVVRFSFFVIGSLFRNLFHFTKKTAARNVIMLYLILSVSSHSTLSVADIRGALSGFIVVGIIYIILGIIIALSKEDFSRTLMQLALEMSSFFSIAVMFSLLSTALAYVAYFCTHLI